MDIGNIKNAATKLANDKDVMEAGKTIGNKVMEKKSEGGSEGGKLDMIKGTATKLAGDKDVTEAGKKIGGKVVDAFKG